jgi:diguanylate cyclase (GGDEF)-like protein
MIAGTTPRETRRRVAPLGGSSPLAPHPCPLYGGSTREREIADGMSIVIIALVDAAVLALVVALLWRRARPAEARGGRKELERRIEHQLLHDELTKLPNRTLFRDRLERALARSVRRRQSCAVLSIDVDRFKLINSSLGHSAGDRLLRETAARLDSVVRPEDTVARTGGDEFMVLLETVGDLEDALLVAQRVEEALRPPFEEGGRELFLSVSIGIALGRGGRDRPEDILQNADVAMHRAKDNGGAREEVFRQEMNPHPLERIGLEADLRRAVERSEFELEYQPVVELADGRIVGIEALLRWNHPERGLIEPLQFVPVAEETGLILPIGRWVLAEAAAAAVDWPELTLYANLSARQLQQPRLRLVDEVAAALSSVGRLPCATCLEITEKAVVQDVEAAASSMRDLKSLGVMLALDDFGTGYSSLSYLRRFPLDVVKLDRSFVAELDDGGEGEAIARALIDVCHALGARVLAEGIEDARQADKLLSLGCDLGQGSRFSPAVPANELAALLDGSPGPRPGVRGA